MSRGASKHVFKYYKAPRDLEQKASFKKNAS